MRYAFGLVGMLVAVGALILIMSQELTYTHTVIKEGNKAQQQALQISGVGAADSVDLKAVNRNGRLEGLLVKSLGPAGPIAKYYGCQVGDEVVSIGPMSVRDWGDAEMAKDQFIETYQRSGQVVVVRNGKKITLPQPAVSPTAIPVVTTGSGTTGGAGATASASPGAGDASQQTQQQQQGQSPDALLKSLNIPTH